eukprot:TRINITY_DN20231_c0_g1_i5.p1 TRINITY_DN20231_c0_g1~~TRINITY_DN20231_c0_g1_i5.p1  ORF type:complete len:120 (-),score=17.15 TRINITY_DN20231_c0_g1_i5:86-445(-)
MRPSQCPSSSSSSPSHQSMLSQHSHLLPARSTPFPYAGFYDPHGRSHSSLSLSLSPSLAKEMMRAIRIWICPDIRLKEIIRRKKKRRFREEKKKSKRAFILINHATMIASPQHSRIIIV